MWSAKKIWFQLHWFIGITAGTVLVVIGLTGALFSFHEEILDLLNPGIASTAFAGSPDRPGQSAASSPVLTPAELLAALQAAGEMRRVERMTLHAEAGRNPQVTFAPAAGERRGQTVFLNAHTGQQLPPQKGTAFFDWIERLHRWLLLPVDIGRPVAGSLAALLLFLSFSGLYLRWPSKPWSPRAWLLFNTRRKGRPFLWGLHSVAGTWVLLVYLVLAGTGVYWGFVSVRSVVDQWAGAPPRNVARAPGPAPAASRPVTIAPASVAPPWQGFERAAGAWQLVQLQLPRAEGQNYQFSWYGPDAPHERARNQLSVRPDGGVQRDERFADLPAGRRALAAIYPLHMGSYFGLAGRIIVTIASLAMMLFAITGWMLYLDRRRKARAVALEGAALSVPAAVGSVAAPGSEPEKGAIAVIHASQSGHAQRLALRTTSLLRRAGHAVDVLAVARLDLQALARYSHALWVASTFGDGDPPDSARGFFHVLQRQAGTALAHQHYGVLALGDRQYPAFCGFGLGLHERLQQAGARPLFLPVTMEEGHSQAWQAWLSALDRHWPVSDDAADDAADAANAQPASPAAAEGGPDDFASWRLVRRTHCNPGSPGNPLHCLELVPVSGRLESWEAGALVEVLPPAGAPGPIVPRSYSVASLPADGHIQLWVRLSVRDGKPGLVSGWLTQSAPGDLVRVRLVANPGFAPDTGHPGDAIFIGNGSGYAGLRAQLLARMRDGRHDNWFIFGERSRSADGWAEAEIAAWLAEGKLRRADFAYSRDPGAARYVTHIVLQQRDALREWLSRGAVVYVCGSYQGMATDVERALVDVLGDEGFAEFAASGRYRRDVY
ncbi:MAG: sulfite reductase flavoprotein subunit alpha [Burkholderiaceae bacterium]